MEAVRADITKSANEMVEKHITDYLKQFQKLERTTDGQLIGWCGEHAYFIHINVAVNAYVDRAKIEIIV